MSLRMVKYPHRGPNAKSLIRLSTTVHVDEYVDFDVDVEIEEFVKGLRPEDRVALMRALAGGSHGPAVDGGVHPEDAYYAFARGDLDTVRRFVCEAAGRIA